VARALIGWSGFVGGNLERDAEFDARYRSTDIDEIRGCSFELVVSAGLPAAKWLANKDPEGDWAAVSGLMGALEEVEAAEFVLISTVDVYGNPIGVEEHDRAPEGLTPYGSHRLAFEEFVAERFPVHRIVRLPALMGPGLRKNVLFDLIHRRQLAVINPDSEFQWYDVRDLWQDLDRVREAGAELVNLVPAPVPTARILAEHFPHVAVGQGAGPTVRYDVRTKYAPLFGARGDYIMDEREVLSRIARFVRDVREGSIECATPSPT
jgi:nucleoside-diphosphate-sugar epimerase